MNQTDFASWDRGNLVNFAIEATGKLNRLEDHIDQLKYDLRTALDNYHKLIIKQAGMDNERTDRA
jgi:hypothetical protein